MFQTPILDVAAGLLLFFLVLSLVCTSLNESISRMLQLREELLWKALTSLFQNSEDEQSATLARNILDHNLVDALSPPGKDTSFIPSDVFSIAVLDLIGLNATDSQTEISDQLDAAKTAKSGDLGDTVFETLKPLAVAAGKSLDDFRQGIERWYGATMDRATALYKGQMQVVTFCVAFALCLMVNADTLMLAKALWTNPQVSAKLAAEAQTVAKLQPPVNVSALPSAANQASSELVTPLPPELQTAKSNVFGLIGWSGTFPWQTGYDHANEHRYPATWWEFFLKLIGLLMTTFAACLGAPFWFDALSKVISLKNGGSPQAAPAAGNQKA
ncbi:MAG: hypothetical protein JST51_05800 [Armatimonadetes bacterium]|nr:hypothetical protein [Armatimonadota bacterium]